VKKERTRNFGKVFKIILGYAASGLIAAEGLERKREVHRREIWHGQGFLKRNASRIK